MKCPRCGTEIDHLKNWRNGGMMRSLDSDGSYSDEDFCPNDNTNYFDCPECDKTLFTDEQEAIKFLKGD